MMLNDGERTLHALRDENHPTQIHQKIGNRHSEKHFEPLPRPCIWDTLVLGKAVEKHVPVPVHNVENHNGDESNEIEKVMQISWPIIFVFRYTRKDKLLIERIYSEMLFDQSFSAGRGRRRRGSVPFRQCGESAVLLLESAGLILVSDSKCWNR